MADMGFHVDQLDGPPKRERFDVGEICSRENSLNANGTRKIYKNIIFISLAFMLLFTAFQSMANLQSSINKVDGLGTYSLSVIYGALVVSCMFVPSWLIKTLSVKWTMVFSMLCYSLYIGAQFYPAFYTLIPAAVILGLGAAPMWSAKCTYLTQAGNIYSQFNGSDVEENIVKFFGIFFLFFQSASIWGNLIASAVLSQRPQNLANSTEGTDLTHCGIYYCPGSSSVSEKKDEISDPRHPDLYTDVGSNSAKDNFKTDITQIYTLAGIFLACSFASAVIITLFVDPLSRLDEENEERFNKLSKDKDKKLSGFSLFIATFKHMRKKEQLLIIPLTFWSGIEQGFFGSDFTAGYVSCLIGVGNVGYVLITFGVCDAICSFSFGYIIKYIGRVPIFILGFIINIVVIVILFTWHHNSEQKWILFVIAGLWGIADAVWQTQINALYGVLFPGKEEAAFSNYRLWESLGFIVAYILQTQVCIYVKLWFLVASISIGIFGYLIIEVMQFQKTK